MKNRLKIVLLAAVLSAACHSKQLKREQHQYDVVQEGSASSVSTTVGAPGETALPSQTPTVTATDADTTTDFAITSSNGNPQPQPGTLASTLTADSGGRMSTPPLPGDNTNTGARRRPRAPTNTSTVAPQPPTEPATTTVPP